MLEKRLKTKKERAQKQKQLDTDIKEIEKVYQQIFKEIIDLRDIKQYVGSSPEIENKIMEAESNLHILQTELWTKIAEAERMKVNDLFDFNVLGDFDINKGEKKCDELKKEIQDLKDFKRFVNRSKAIDIELKIRAMETELNNLKHEVKRHKLKKEQIIQDKINDKMNAEKIKIDQILEKNFQENKKIVSKIAKEKKIIKSKKFEYKYSALCPKKENIISEDVQSY